MRPCVRLISVPVLTPDLPKAKSLQHRICQRRTAHTQPRQPKPHEVDAERLKCGSVSHVRFCTDEFCFTFSNRHHGRGHSLPHMTRSGLNRPGLIRRYQAEVEVPFLVVMGQSLRGRDIQYRTSTPTIARCRPPWRVTPAGRLCGGRRGDALGRQFDWWERACRRMRPLSRA